MRYKNCIFDFDYTLGDATKGIIQSVHFALGEMGLPLPSPDKVKQTVGMPLTDAFTFFTGSPDPGLKALFVQLFSKSADEIMTQNTVLFTDTAEVLALLRAKGAGLGIVSTKYRYRLLQIVDKFGIGHIFDVIVGSDDVKNPKPDPEGLIKAMESLGAARKDVLYVGDSAIDIKTAKNAGVDFVAVTTGVTEREAFLPFPHVAIVDSLSAIPDVIGA